MLIIIITSLCLLGFGLWYAWLEYKRPIAPTYWAVIIGVGVTMAGQVVMTAAAHLSGYGLVGVIAGVVVPFALTGLPMAIGQEFKERRFIDEANGDA